MMRLTAISPYSKREERYDGVLVTAGFETRAAFAIEYLRPTGRVRTACGFTSRELLSYGANIKTFLSLGVEIEKVEERDVEEWTRNWFRRCIEDAREASCIHIFVDISSMSRVRMASVVAAICACDAVVDIEVDFVYSIAAWKPPRHENPSIVHAGPVLPCFAGWTPHDLPVSVVLGLGYEPELAVGACEYLEAATAWTFTPLSEEGRYEKAVTKANKALLDRMAESQKIYYTVEMPVDLFGVLQGMLRGLARSSRPVVVPFGPKLFTLCSLLLGALFKEISVWSISSGQHGDPEDSIAAGYVIGLRASFSPQTIN